MTKRTAMIVSVSAIIGAVLPLPVVLAFVAAIWAGFGVAAAGYVFAYYQGKFPAEAQKNRAADYWAAFFVALFGPIGFLLVMKRAAALEYGWRLR